MSDAKRLTDRAREDGIDTDLEIWDGMWYVWHLFANHVPENQQGLTKLLLSSASIVTEANVGANENYIKNQHSIERVLAYS